MRRSATALLLVLGIFALVLGGALRFYVHNQLAVAPLDPDATTVSKGSQMTVFYPGTLKQRTDATLTATTRVRGSLVAPEAKVDGDVAVWKVGIVIEDDNGTLVNASVDQVCLNRRTSESVSDCASQSIDDDKTAKHTGLAYKFPFNTQKKDYEYFDSTLKASPVIRFDSEDTVNGLPVYRFVQSIPATKVEDIDVPGDLVNGKASETVHAGMFYQNTRTLWVEPYSGAIVRDDEDVRQVLRGPDGQDGTVLLSGKLVFTQETVQAQVKTAKDARSQLQLIFDTGPLVLLIAGLLLVAGGVVLLVTSGRGRPREVPVQRFRRQQPVTT